jgi:hypothetical protein
VTKGEINMCKEERQFGIDDLTTTLKVRAEWVRMGAQDERY